MLCCVLTIPMASMAKSTVPKNNGILLTVPTGSRPTNDGASRKMQQKINVKLTMVMQVAIEENGARSLRFLTQEINISGINRYTMYIRTSVLPPRQASPTCNILQNTVNVHPKRPHLSATLAYRFEIASNKHHVNTTGTDLVQDQEHVCHHSEKQQRVLKLGLLI